jgi:hypothetical protein
MKASELIDMALSDAADWQSNLADAYRNMPDSPERKEALALAKKYRRLRLKRIQRRMPAHTTGRVSQ